MNTLLRGTIAGFIAGLTIAILYFIDYGPGNSLNTVAQWFALDNKDSGRAIGFLLLVVLGTLFGLVFGLIQSKREITIGRAIGTGVGLGVAWWVIFAYIIGGVVGHISFAKINFSSLYTFIPCLLYGLLLGTIYFQSTVRQVSYSRV